MFSFKDERRIRPPSPGVFLPKIGFLYFLRKRPRPGLRRLQRTAASRAVQLYLRTISCMASNCCSISTTSLNWVRARTRLWVGYWVLK